MTNTTILRGACPAPFLQLLNFPSTDGFLHGRFCAPAPTAQGTVDCCLPCPLTDWVYSDRFKSVPRITSWINVAGLVCAGSLLVSYFVLPTEKTNRHYLTIGMIISVCFLELGFIIPLAAQPEQCHDAITPNDMYSDMTCAFSGASLILGGLAVIMWGFLRSLSLHLQVCWKVVPGPKFFWSSILAGIVIPVVFISVALPVTGLSYRFGNTCHINHEKALQDYWGPLLAFAVASTILQFATFGYCIKVYIKSLFDDTATSDDHSGLPRYNSSVRTVTATQAFRRIKKVVALQWRSIIIVLIIIANVTFLAVIFISMDRAVSAAKKDISKAQPWIVCLVMNGGDKTKCLDKAGSLIKNESTVMAALLLLSLTGFWTWLFLGRTSIVYAWIELVRRPFSHSHDFVSVDARRLSADPRTYEMILSPPQTAHAVKSPDPLIFNNPIDKDCFSPLSPSIKSNRTSKTDYFGKETAYTSPVQSFSSPRPPSAGISQGREWDPESTHAKGFRQP